MVDINTVFENLVITLKKNFEHTEQVLVSINCSGQFSAPTKRKNFYQTGHFLFSKDCFSNLSEMMEDYHLVCLAVKKEKND